MKSISRIISIFSILIICMAGLPLRTVQAYSTIYTDTVWSTPTAVTSDLVITSGGNLPSNQGWS